ncbi:MAG: DNA repair protein RadC [Rickettsiales bacterium]|nr:MAG: DNA repair protein RadC [Rickettsiales bacterium]
MHQIGHRQRLRDRLIKSNKGSLPDYEILELILCLAKPRGDTKPLAKTLITEYGSFARVISANSNSLQHIHGIGESVIAAFRVIQEGAIRLIKEDVTENNILESWKSLIDYCRATMGHISTEQFRVLYLDRKNMIIADDLQEHGTVDQISIFPREIIKRALYLESSAIILVHNHPSGNTKPSNVDIELTKRIMQISEMLGIALHDHIIISSKKHYSFKNNGLI